MLRSLSDKSQQGILHLEKLPLHLLQQERDPGAEGSHALGWDAEQMRRDLQICLNLPAYVVLWSTIGPESILQGGRLAHGTRVRCESICNPKV